MKIGIMGAMEEEVGLLKQGLHFLTIEEIAGRKYYCGKLHGIETVIVFSRWGKVASASTTTTLISKFKVDFVIFTGVAGAANEQLNIGDVVVASDLIQHDMDASPFFPKYQIPLTTFTTLPVDKALCTLSKKSVDSFLNTVSQSICPTILSEFDITEPKSLVGTVASGDQFIADKNKVLALGAEIENLLCVEMEGAAVAQVCLEHSIKFVVIRVISDKADHSAPIDFKNFISSISSYYSKCIVENIYTNFAIELGLNNKE